MRKVLSKIAGVPTALIVVSALLIAACGTSADENSSKAEGGAADTTSGDTVKIGDSLSAPSGGVSFDPISPGAATSWRYMHLLYGSLLTRNVDGSYDADLATNWDIVDDFTVSLELRDGVSFTDGTEFNAEAVRFNILRALEAEEESYSVSDSLKDVEDVEIVDNLNVQIHLSEPVAAWLFEADRPFFSSVETLMPSPASIDTIDAAPVGAGAYILDEYADEEKLSATKNPDYWGADDVGFERVEFTYLAPGTSQIVALRSGDVDIVNLPSSALSEVTDIEGVEVVDEVEGSMFWAIYMCKDRPPFDDVRVRRAFNYALNRDAVVDLALGGTGEPATGFLPPAHRFNDPELDSYYDQDLDEVETLLEDAGVKDLSLDVMYKLATPAAESVGEVLRSQLAESGITMNPVGVQDVVSEFFSVPGAAAGIITTGNGYGFSDLVPGSIGNACNFDDPTLNSLVADIKKAEPDSDQQEKLMADAQKYVLDEALITWLAWDSDVTAFQSDRLAEVAFQLGKWAGPKEILVKGLKPNE